ncbi:DUF4153 domain-containing protein [Streptococcus halotolerans]|uniref:DUF4153 domain-containing protein n=1 Tax=Streptococcus halotolerans TaxID=1814128 RepID=UPI00078897C8|nr:DUF4153 domain-containing protein [Streptococcus halotolerans]
MTKSSSFKKPLIPLYLKKLSDSEFNHYKIGAQLTYLPAYFYIVNLFNHNPSYLILAALLTIIITEWNQPNQVYLDSVKQKSPEDRLLLGSLFLQLLGFAIWGIQAQFDFFRLFGLHLTFVYYVLARNKQFIQGRFGVFFLRDAWRGFWTIPIKSIRLRSQILSHPRLQQSNKSKLNPQFTLTLLGSIGVAVLLVAFAISQLQAVSQHFKLVTDHWFTQLNATFFQFSWYDYVIDFLRYGILSLPIGAYLYGLLFAPLIKGSQTDENYQVLQEKLDSSRILPTFSSYIIIGSLCLIYALFLILAFADLQTLFQAQTISPQAASETAVSGFWQLVRVALLNFTTLAASYFLVSSPIWDQKVGRFLLTIFFTFSFIFALLAAWKLFGIYIYLFGLTPRRLISGWFVTVLIVWTLLTLIRLHKPFQSIRIGLFYLIFSFSCLSYLYALWIP